MDGTDPQDDGPESAEVASDGKVDDDDSSKSVSGKSDSEKEDMAKKETDMAASRASGSDMEAEPQNSTSTSGAASGRLSPDTGSCQGKRRRDDADQNPRETKRITPPPEKEKPEIKGKEEVKETPSAKPVSLCGL